MRNNSADLKLDEFGRLVREGASDSDTSESPRRNGVTARKRYRSPSRSLSPWRQRIGRRSPCYRDERKRHTHRFFSRKQSRSRSPVSRHYSDFHGIKMNGKKGQSFECFHFKKGRCYRGASCRFVHHMPGKSGNLKYTRGQESHPGSPRTSRSPSRGPDHMIRILPAKESKDELHHDLHAFDEAEKSKEIPISSTNLDQNKLPSLEFCSLAASDGILKNNFLRSPVAVLSRKIDSSSPDPCEQTFQKPLQIVDDYMAPIANHQSHLHRDQLSVQTCPGSQNNQQCPVAIPNSFSSLISVNDPSTVLPSHSVTGYDSNPLGNDHAYSKDGILRESHFDLPLQNSRTSYSYSFGQSNAELLQPSMIGSHSLLVGGLPSDIKSSKEHPNLNRPQYGMQYSAGADFIESSRITPYSCKQNQPDVKDYVGSGIPLNSYPPVPVFNQPMSSEFFRNASISENDATSGTKNGTPISSSYLPRGGSGTGGDDEALVSPSRSIFPDSDQYDPLIDSIEPSVSRENQVKHEAVGDSDDLVASAGFERTLNLEAFNREGKPAVSVNFSPETIEHGEMAGKEVGAGMNASTSDPNSEANGMSVGEIEGGHVKMSGESKSEDSRSIKLFKISIATFVKEILKPSWRQGDMSKEAFKTIVKKTIDKVSGAMRRQKIPKSQAKIDRYIDSSRGKLTKLVMGYLEKYAKA